jgi:hypothetical protein
VDGEDGVIRIQGFHSTNWLPYRASRGVLHAVRVLSSVPTIVFSISQLGPNTGGGAEDSRRVGQQSEVSQSSTSLGRMDFFAVPVKKPVWLVTLFNTNLQRSISQALPCVVMQDVDVSFKAWCQK